MADDPIDRMLARVDRGEARPATVAEAREELTREDKRAPSRRSLLSRLVGRDDRSSARRSTR